MPMRLLHSLSLILLALGAGACDIIQESQFDKRPGYMERLDGTWHLTVSQHTIATSGAMTDAPNPSVSQVQIGSSMQCNRIQIDAAGDADRVLRHETTAGVVNRCYIITADATLDRLIFVGEATLSTDVAYNIRENTDDRQVWSYFAPQANGSVIETRWTLTK